MNNHEMVMVMALGCTLYRMMLYSEMMLTDAQPITFYNFINKTTVYRKVTLAQK